MSSAALVLPAASPPHRQSVSVKSYSGPKQFAGGAHRILQTYSPPLSSCFSGGIATYGDNVSTSGRAAKVRAGIRSRSSPSSGRRQSNAAVAEDGNKDLLPPMEGTAGSEQGTRLESNGVDRSSVARSVRATEEIEADEGGKLEVIGEDRSLPTMEDIVAKAAQQGIKLEVNSFGPTFEIVVSSLDEDKVFGKANGWITVWTKGKILHLETVKLERGMSKQVRNMFGAGFFVGASTLRYGLDQGCQTAELLAIYDDAATHDKLVKYYSRIGFKTLYEVNEEDWKYFPDRVVWGGVGTRMDADCEELLRKWSKILKPKSKSGS